MIRYPILKEDFTISITAPSSGLEEGMYHFIDEIKERFEQDHPLRIGETTLTHYKAKSADAHVRAKELNDFLQDNETDIIIPPFGGELAIELLDKIDYNAIKEKWILGYSDISIILLAVTLKTGIATAHGTNIVDLRGKYSDDTTKMWEQVLKTTRNNEITQYSSEKYQSSWNHDVQSDYIFNFDQKTEWKTLSNDSIRIEGRLLGGCIDVIHHMVGTPYGDIEYFRAHYIKDEPIIWYLENSDSQSTDFRRMLLQMKYAGWFKNCSGIVFGRTLIKDDFEGYTILDVYEDLARELQIPIIYDIDCGHMPPQITFVNGAYGIIEYSNGKGKVTQIFI